LTDFQQCAEAFLFLDKSKDIYIRGRVCKKRASAQSLLSFYYFRYDRKTDTREKSQSRVLATVLRVLFIVIKKYIPSGVIFV